MKNILIILLCLCANLIYSQNNTVKGRGILYTNGVPTVPINAVYDSEWAVDTTNNKTIYLYDRDSAAWIKAGYFIQQTNVLGVPSYTPHDAQSIIAINNGDSIFHYRSGSWNLVSGGGGGGITSNTISLSGNIITSDIDGSFIDTTLVIGEVNGNLSGNTQTINVNDVTDTMMVIGSNVLTFSSDSIKSTVNGINSNAVYLGGYTDTDTQDLSITAGKGTINLVNSPSITLGDSSSVNEGLIAWGVTSNLADVISNTLGSETLYMAGRNGLVISDSSGYMLFTQTTGGTDNQVIDTFVLTTKNLRLSIEDDAEATKVVYLGMFLDTATSFAGDVSGIYSNLQLGSGVVTTTEIAANTIQTGDVDDDHIIVHDGNTRGTTLKIGTNDNHQLDFETNGTVRLSLNTSGVLSVGSTTPSLLSNASLTSAASFTVGNSANTLTLSSSSSSAAAILLSTTDATTGGVTIGGNSYTSTSIAKKILKFTDNYTSSTTGGTMSYAEITGTINCTGTNNSAIYGFSSVPTLTSIASGKYYAFYSYNDDADSYGFYQVGINAKNYFNAPTIFDRHIEILQRTTPSTPASGYGIIYKYTDDSLYYMNEAGANFNLCRIGTGGGVTTNTLSLSGNTMTSTVDGVSDTSLVIGEVNANLSGNQITVNVNDVTDTTLVIGEHTVTLSGNQITSNTNDITDTTLVIGELDISSATNTMTIEVNSVTDNALIINSNVVSYGTVDGILTVNINGVSDTTLITGASDGNGIYDGSDIVPAGTYAHAGSWNGDPRTFWLGHWPNSPQWNITANERGFAMDTTGRVIVAGVDSVNGLHGYLLLDNDDLYLRAQNEAGTTYSGLQVEYTQTIITTDNGTDATYLIAKKDSMYIESDVTRINSGKIVLADNGGTGEGTNGQVWTSGGVGQGGSWTTAGAADGNNSIYNFSGTIDSTRYTQIHVDSVMSFGYMTSHPSYALNGKERALYFDEDRRVSLIGGDSLTSVYTLVQLSNAISMFSSKSDLSDYSSAEFATGAITLKATDVGDSQDSYWYVKPDSVYGISKRFRVNADSFHLNIAGSSGTTGQLLMSNGAGWSATWATVGVLTDGDKTDITVSSSGTVWNIDAGVIGSTEVNDDQVILNLGNTTAATMYIGSNDNFGLNLEIQDTTAISIGTDHTVMLSGKTSTTNALVDRFYISTNTYNTAAAGFGGSLMFKGETSTTEDVGMATIGAIWDVATHASYTSAITFQVANGGAAPAEVFRLTGAANHVALLTAGTLTDAKNALRITSTLPTVQTATNSAVDIQVASAGSSAQIGRAVNIDLTSGYTGSSPTQAYRANNAAAGTGGTVIVSACNQGAFGGATGVTTGANVGVYGSGTNAILSVGIFGRAVTAKNTATNIGVYGSGLNTGTTPIHIGGFFGLLAADPTFESAALICDNGSQTSPIFLARDNGTVVFQIQDNSKIFHSAGNFAATLDATALDLVLRKAITGTAASELFINGSALQNTLPATNAIWNVSIDIVAVCTAAGNGSCVAGDSWIAKRYCAIKRLNTTTSLVDAVETIGTDKDDANMVTAVTTITADDTNEALKITWTPPSTAGSTSTFRVVATVRLTQVQY